MNKAGAFLLKSLVPPTKPITRMMGRWNNRSVAPYMREINRRKKMVELNHMLKDGKVPIPRRSSFRTGTIRQSWQHSRPGLGRLLMQSCLPELL
jgi:hypothetical protein